VDPTRCPYRDRTKFYLMALLVLLNAGVAAIAVPTGFATAYRHLSIFAEIWLGVLGAGIIGAIDALVVGTWVTLIKERLYPTDEPPKFPGPGRRIGLFSLRILLTAALALVLGQLLTLSVNSSIVGKQLASTAVSDRDTVIATATSADRKILSTDRPKLTAAQLQLQADMSLQASDVARAQCELYGKPLVPNCTGIAGAGPLYTAFSTKAKTTDQTAINTDQDNITHLQAAIDAASNDVTSLASANATNGKARPILTQQNLANIAAAGKLPQGLSAARGAFNAYAKAHHWSFLDRNFMSILVLGVDIVPVGWKLIAGTSLYEAELWMADYEDALWRRRRRQAQMKVVDYQAQLVETVAEQWAATRSEQAREFLGGTPIAVADGTRGPVDDQVEDQAVDLRQAEADAERRLSDGETAVVRLEDERLASERRAQRRSSTRSPGSGLTSRVD
jgi:hypothetical protein